MESEIRKDLEYSKRNNPKPQTGKLFTYLSGIIILSIYLIIFCKGVIVMQTIDSMIIVLNELFVLKMFVLIISFIITVMIFSSNKVKQIYLKNISIKVTALIGYLILLFYNLGYFKRFEITKSNVVIIAIIEGICLFTLIYPLVRDFIVKIKDRNHHDKDRILNFTFLFYLILFLCTITLMESISLDNYQRVLATKILLGN